MTIDDGNQDPSRKAGKAESLTHSLTLLKDLTEGALERSGLTMSDLPFQPEHSGIAFSYRGKSHISITVFRTSEGEIYGWQVQKDVWSTEEQCEQRVGFATLSGGADPYLQYGEGEVTDEQRLLGALLEATSVSADTPATVSFSVGLPVAEYSPLPATVD